MRAGGQKGEWELVLWGGNANNGSNAGLGYANTNNAFSNSNANIGSRHTMDNEIGKRKCVSFPLAP